jgi:GT2 family glycosyltransferase
MQLPPSILDPMELSVLIPTYQRPEAINRCLRELAIQQTDAQFEIIIGLDGDASSTPDPEVPQELASCTRVSRYGRVGLLRLRQEMLAAASGQLVLWLNDDVIAHQHLLQSHVAAHLGRSDTVIVAGKADWKPIAQPNLFDQLVQESDLVFFAQPNHSAETDFRNCYGLNLSFPREFAIDVGGVASVEEHYGYEDIELAWRLVRAGASCVYEPAARVMHDHRYTPRDVHRREYLLGRAAFAFGQTNPSFAIDLFGIDVCREQNLTKMAVSIETAWRDAIRVERSFLSLDQRPANALEDGLLPVLAEHWVLLKRLLWRWGLLDAARGIEPRWSLLVETAPDRVLRHSPIPV